MFAVEWVVAHARVVKMLNLERVCVVTDSALSHGLRKSELTRMDVLMTA